MTSCPCAASARQTAPPTKPDAPVTATRMTTAPRSPKTTPYGQGRTVGTSGSPAKTGEPPATVSGGRRLSAPHALKMPFEHHFGVPRSQTQVQLIEQVRAHMHV